MTRKDSIIKEISDCIDAAKPLILFLQGGLNKAEKENYSFHSEYQRWYSKSLKLMEYLGKDRLSEFKSYYEIDPKRKRLNYETFVIQDYLKDITAENWSYPDFNYEKQTLTNLINQYTILVSVYERAESIIFDIRSELFSNLQELELETSRSLLKINIRASGVIAGVVLESFLKTIMERHSINLPKKNPALTDLNEELKKHEIYDILVWRKISYLGDIRNICAHKKDIEPTKAQVEELIEGVNWVTKNIG